MKYNKSQGLEMSTIILAALGIIILLVLVGLVTGKISWVGKALVTCPGECLSQEECEKAQGYDLGSGYKAPEHQVARQDYKEGESCGAYQSVPGSTMICCSSKQKKQ